MTALIEDGGFTMPLLVLALYGVWFALGWRAVGLRASVLSPAAQVLSQARSNEQREASVAPIRAALDSGRVFLTTLVVLAPLIGLLGTVTGMIETFDSLDSGALYAQGGGIAAGVGQALLTTQVGLAVAIPGALLGRLLDRRQQTLSARLDAWVAAGNAA